MYDRWDDDGDNRISQSEFTGSYFDILDVDSDNEINMDDWNKARPILSGIHTGMKDKTGKSGKTDQTVKTDESDQSGILGQGQTDQPNQTGTDRDQTMQDDQDVRYGAGMGSLNDLDNDNDNVVDEDEFEKSKLASNKFSSLDSNKDNYLSKTEFYDHTFNWWDTDSDGNITQTEFNQMKEIGGDKSWFERIF
ncbi:MAG: hypothetical protein HC906_09500 [Bacteroidales bacterium]|nr:hypothetical protein [Bacteroidales bacterium]